MKPPRSIASTLSWSLAAVGVGGALFLMAFIAINYHMTFSRLSDHQAFHRAMKEMADHVVVPLLILALPMILAGRWAIRRALRPLDAAISAAEAARTRPATLSLSAENFPHEVAPFVTGVNHLLGRLQHANDANAAFAADVAHELRTPLTLLALELDRSADPQAPALKGEVARMQKLVHQLMLIAQIDASEAAQEQREAVDLALIADEVVAHMAPHAISEGRALAFENHAPAPFSGRNEALSAALRNLVENAIRVTPQGGTVLVTAGPGASLHVTDGGPGLTQAQLDHLTSRLVRADSASKHGAGLGLAIVSKIVAAHGGVLKADPARKTISILLPI